MIAARVTEQAIGPQIRHLPKTLAPFKKFGG